MSGEAPSPEDGARRRSAERRKRLHELAAVYDRCVIRAWITKDVPGIEDEHRAALRELDDARGRMDRAGRGLA